MRRDKDSHACRLESASTETQETRHHLISAQSSYSTPNQQPHRLFGGGVPSAASPAFLFPSPITNLPLSIAPATGVPSLGLSVSTNADEILENPGLGAGDPLLPPAWSAGEAVPDKDPELKFDAGAGRVMNPVESS